MENRQQQARESSLRLDLLNQGLSARCSPSQHPEHPTDVLSQYEEVLRTLWDVLTATLGKLTVITLMEQAERAVKLTMPMAAPLRVGPEGVDLSAFRQLADASHLDMTAIFTAFLSHFLGLLHQRPGGDVLLCQLSSVRVLALLDAHYPEPSGDPPHS